MALLGDDDMVVCHRAAYANISPQACLEKHVRNEEACGKCRKYEACLIVMIEATQKSAEEIVDLSRAGKISGHGNPLVNTASKADWERGQIVNSRILYINGLRVRQGFAKEFRAAGGVAERYLSLILSAEDVEKIKNGVREVAVDELIAGRVVYRFEWNADGDKNKPSPAEDGKGGEKRVSFRLQPVNLDTFSR